MLQPASAVRGTPSIPACDQEKRDERPAGTIRLAERNHPALDRLPPAGASGEQLVREHYAACTGSASPVARYADHELAQFRQRLAEWRARQAAGLPCATDQQVVEDLKSALIAAATIGAAHTVEMVLLAYSNHPMVRLSAVSHPYVLATFLESTLKRLADVPDPDPDNRTGLRFREKIVAALVNWNHVQPALDNVLKTPLSRCLKVVATAAISAVRDVAERAETMALLQDLPPDAPAGPQKLTDRETLFINCLMCWLRNVGVDLIRQVLRSGGEAGAPIVLPAAPGVIERFARPVFLGPHVPGALPAAAISAQPAFADALQQRHGAPGRASRMEEILQVSHDPF